MRRPARALAVLLLLPFVLPAPAAAEPDAPAFLPTSLGRAIVGYQDGFLPETAVGETHLGFPVLLRSEELGILVLQARDLRDVLATLSIDPGIAYVEDDLPMVSLATPNDPSYGNQYGPGLMGFPTAWDAAGYGSSAVKVAVIDSGLYKAHADFTPASRFLTGYDYVNGDSNPNDDCGHGTHVTGTVAATTNNGAHVAGMSQATILPLKALGAVGGLLGGVQCTGSTSGVAQAIVDAANQGAKVISMSLGGGSSTTLSNAVGVNCNVASASAPTSGATL